MRGGGEEIEYSRGVEIFHSFLGFSSSMCYFGIVSYAVAVAEMLLRCVGMIMCRISVTHLGLFGKEGILSAKRVRPTAIMRMM